MTNEEILKAAIKKAEKNGWDKKPMIYGGLKNKPTIDESLCFVYLFSHSFARCFFGEEQAGLEVMENGKWVRKREQRARWDYHLSCMVKLEDPIKYLEQFLK